MNNIYKFEIVEDIKRFIVGGNAIITLESKKTGTWFTFKIKKSKKDKDVENAPLFVYVLVGPDNENSYTYMGTIFNCNTFKLTKNSKIKESALSYKAFTFFFNLLQKNKVHNEMNVYHRGVCCVCGRTLTTAPSLKNGIGPFCSGRLNKKIKS